MNPLIPPSVRALAAACLVIPAAIIAGCGQHFDKISDLNGDPAKYLHHDVTVAGEVTKVYELPLGISDLSAYRINDGTGQIWVVSHNGAPNEGDKLGLKGRLEPIANISRGLLGNLVGNIVEEKQRRSE